MKSFDLRIGYLSLRTFILKKWKNYNLLLHIKSDNYHNCESVNPKFNWKYCVKISLYWPCFVMAFCSFNYCFIGDLIASVYVSFFPETRCAWCVAARLEICLPCFTTETGCIGCLIGFRHNHEEWDTHVREKV